MNAIEIRNLVKIYRGKKRMVVEALKGLSLDVGQGEVFGFLGPNGAGKSTTIKTLMGLIDPTSGEARIMGECVSSCRARRKVGYLPENPAFYDYLSAEEYLHFVGETHRMTDRDIMSRADDVLRLLELWDSRKRPIRSYSKGMVQRLGLAQVLVHDPDVLILDEPMSGLDPLGRALVKRIIMDLKARGKCVFFSTHITADVESVCDRVGIIVNGNLESVAEVETLMREGIEGYLVRTSSGGVGVETIVEPQKLADFLVETRRAGDEVTLVEPMRRNLEEFFLSVVKGGRC
ncbi:MAG: ABC transporter ATP-binding protein [Desulfuromonadales bacterium]|nr:MAG: ABC transporter ATP-binding protein [Desulfuromonadales bacterium]